MIVGIDVGKDYAKDELFNPKSIHNRDNCLGPWHLLQSALRKRDIEIHTLDTVLEKKATPGIIIYTEIRDKDTPLPVSCDKSRKWLILFENEVICPLNWKMERHAEYEKVFTWRTDLIDNKKYFKLNYSQVFPAEIPRNEQNKNLCTLIAGNKASWHPLELYSERLAAIRWFEKNEPEVFEFYGMGWDRRYFKFKKLNRIDFLTKLLVPRYSTYRGKVENKLDTFAKYKFAICYENAKNIPGYITEKIMDSLFAGCVPVYYGAPNVADYIPQSCFIDMQIFANYAELFRFLKNMNDQIYQQYISAIKDFLTGSAAYQFTAEYFVKTLSDAVG